MKTSRRAAEVNNKSDVKNGWAAQYSETTGVTEVRRAIVRERARTEAL